MCIRDSPTGDDNNPGTESLPYRSVQAACTKAKEASITEVQNVNGGTGGTANVYNNIRAVAYKELTVTGVPTTTSFAYYAKSKVGNDTEAANTNNYSTDFTVISDSGFLYVNGQTQWNRTIIAGVPTVYNTQIRYNGVVIVDTNDAVLVVNKDDCQKVKEVVDHLTKIGSLEGSTHQTMYRPWGSYTSIAKGDKWQLKTIEVKPNAKLSLQMHKHRADHWIVVKGVAEIEINNNKKILEEIDIFSLNLYPTILL